MFSGLASIICHLSDLGPPYPLLPPWPVTRRQSAEVCSIIRKPCPSLLPCVTLLLLSAAKLGSRWTICFYQPPGEHRAWYLGAGKFPENIISFPRRTRPAGSLTHKQARLRLTERYLPTSLAIGTGDATAAAEAGCFKGLAKGFNCG